MNNLVRPSQERIVDLDVHMEGAALGSPPWNGYGYEPYIADGPHLRDHWQSVRKHMALVIGLTLFITIGVAVYLALKPAVYEAEAQVQVNLENINPQLTGSKTGSVVVNPVNDPAYFNTQLQLLVRPSLLRRVVKKLDLQRDPSFHLRAPKRANSTWDKLLAKMGVGRARNRAMDGLGQAAAQASASKEEVAEATQLAPYVEAIQAGLTVEPVKEARLPIKETRLINIAFRHTDREIATKVVNTIADTFVLSNLEEKNDLTDLTREILHRRVNELQTQVRTNEEQLINYAKKHEILTLDPSQNTVVERLVGLNRQLLEAENERKLAEASYRAALKPGAAEALAEDTTKEMTELDNRLAELRQRRAQLLVESTEEWPEVKELDQQILVLEKHIGKNRERSTAVIVTNLETKYRQSLAREESLRAAFNQQRGETVKQNEAAIYYRMMQQEVETGKQLLNGILQRQKENEGMLAGLINNIRVNDYAVIPQVPVGPRRLLFTGVAFTLSLAFSLGLAILIDYMDNSIRTSEDVEKTLRARTLASIPSMNEVRLTRLLKPSDSYLMSGAMRKRLPNQSELLLDHSGQSGLTEVYRQLRTTMLLSNTEGALNTLLVTASMPGEGKTTTAVNTALTLVSTGASVLLIDADTRNPRIHKIFGFDNEKGLSTILLNGIAQPEVPSIIKRHEASGISVLTSGPAEPNFTELLGSAKMRGLIAELRGNFNYVIIDSPPVAHFADSTLISQMVDGVLLVVNSGKVPREVVRLSHQLLQDVGATIVGVVLNNVKVLPYDYNYYQEYYSRSTKDAAGKSFEAERVGEPYSYASSPNRFDRQLFIDGISGTEKFPSRKS